MTQKSQNVKDQIRLIQEAMERAGIWSDMTPLWVKSYNAECIPDIWQWMQYIYLPMRLSGNTDSVGYLAPKIKRYIHEDPALTQILQLSIELDAITPTIKKFKP